MRRRLEKGEPGQIDRALARRRREIQQRRAKGARVKRERPVHYERGDVSSMDWVIVACSKFVVWSEEWLHSRDRSKVTCKRCLAKQPKTVK